MKELTLTFSSSVNNKTHVSNTAWEAWQIDSGVPKGSEVKVRSCSARSDVLIEQDAKAYRS